MVAEPNLNPAFSEAWSKPAAEWTEEDFQLVSSVLEAASEFTNAISLAGLMKMCGGILPKWIPGQFLEECIQTYGPLYAAGISGEDIQEHINFLASSPNHAQLMEWQNNPKFSFGRFGSVLNLVKLKVICRGSEQDGLVALYGEYDGKAMARGRKFVGRKLSDAMLKEQERRDFKMALGRFAYDWNKKHPTGPLHCNASAIAANVLKREEEGTLPDYLIGFKLPKTTLRKLLAF